MFVIIIALSGFCKIESWQWFFSNHIRSFPLNYFRRVSHLHVNNLHSFYLINNTVRSCTVQINTRRRRIVWRGSFWPFWSECLLPTLVAWDITIQRQDRQTNHTICHLTILSLTRHPALFSALTIVWNQSGLLQLV